MAELRSIVISCRDPYVMAPFWAAALNMQPVAEDAANIASRSLAPDESVLLKLEGQPDVWITPVKDLDPAGNRLHVDIDVEAGEIRRLLDAGASVVRTERGWTVMADPEGNEFCAVTPQPG